jgi:hypothetical protein
MSWLLREVLLAARETSPALVLVGSAGRHWEADIARQVAGDQCEQPELL